MTDHKCDNCGRVGANTETLRRQFYPRTTVIVMLCHPCLQAAHKYEPVGPMSVTPDWVYTWAFNLLALTGLFFFLRLLVQAWPL